jgi:hypothetical protein
MKKIYVLILFLMFNGIIIKCQNKFEIEASEGFVYFDYFGNEPEGWDKEFAGYGFQSEIDFWKKIYQKNKFNIRLGIGYTQFNYLSAYHSSFFANGCDINKSQFINFKLGSEYRPLRSKITFTLNSTHYIALGKRFHSQYRWFTNLDLGLKINLYKNISVSFWTPITLRPILDGYLTFKPIELFKLDFDPWVEMTGLNLGISYSFGKL